MLNACAHLKICEHRPSPFLRHRRPSEPYINTITRRSERVNYGETEEHDMYVKNATKRHLLPEAPSGAPDRAPLGGAAARKSGEERADCGGPSDYRAYGSRRHQR